MYVRAGRPAFARPCVGVHKRTSLISSSLLLQVNCKLIKRDENPKKMDGNEDTRKITHHKSEIFWCIGRS